MLVDMFTDQLVSNCVLGNPEFAVDFTGKHALNGGD
jgi:hypothetical protein